MKDERIAFNEQLGIQDIIDNYITEALDNRSDKYSRQFTYRIGSKLVRICIDSIDINYKHDLNANN